MNQDLEEKIQEIKDRNQSKYKTDIKEQHDLIKEVTGSGFNNTAKAMKFFINQPMDKKNDTV